MSSIRIKVQIGYEKSNDRFQKVNPPLKFVYLIEAPSHKTIHELTRTLQNYINQEFFYNIPIVQLVTHDGFILSKSDLCANVLKDNEQIVCIDMHTYTRENDSSLNFDKLWLAMKQHDVSDNEEKSIEIGRTNSSKLFVQLRGTSAIHGLYIFNFYELIKIASEKRTGNLNGSKRDNSKLSYMKKLFLTNSKAHHTIDSSIHIFFSAFYLLCFLASTTCTL